MTFLFYIITGEGLQTYKLSLSGLFDRLLQCPSRPPPSCSRRRFSRPQHAAPAQPTPRRLLCPRHDLRVERPAAYAPNQAHAAVLAVAGAATIRCMAMATCSFNRRGQRAVGARGSRLGLQLMVMPQDSRGRWRKLVKRPPRRWMLPRNPGVVLHYVSSSIPSFVLLFFCGPYDIVATAEDGGVRF